MTTNPATTEEAFRRVVAETVLSLDGPVMAPAASTT
jgi:hypothetical protein